MSKIYEALLRAELERKTAKETKAEPGPSERGPQDILASLHQATSLVPERSPSLIVPPVPGPAPLPEMVFPSAETASVRVESTPAASAPPVVDLDRIVTYAWKPSLKQLPSLEERGTAVEQFRSLRSRMYEFRDLNPLKVIAVSSALPQEGKSFVAANLALSFARHKAGRVLLIDGDMRRSSLHMLLGCPNRPGLTEYLSGKNSLAEVMQHAQASDGMPLPPGVASLTFIAGGSDAENAADLSGNSRFDELIRVASPLFDWIVVDTPPVNLVADGVNLARACDGALLIVRAGVTKYEAIQRALSELKASNMIGVVLNAVEKPPVTGGYYGYDGYDSKKE